VSATPRRALALSLLVVLGGCSYSPNPTSFPTHLKTIAVPVFQNRTTQPALEEEVTTAVVNRFIRGSKLRIVPESEADLIVTGAATGYKNAVFGFNATEKAQEYQVAVTVSVTVRDRVKNRELWKDDQLIRTSNYFVVQVGDQPPQTEDSGRANAIDKLADAILNRTVENW
jgi:lipopolysaccharide assembly LptE-like protein